MDDHRGKLTGLALQSDLPEATDDPSASADLPSLRARNALEAVDSTIIANVDEEAAEFLLASARAKLWAAAFRSEKDAVAQAQEFVGGDYAMRVRETFLEEYAAASSLKPPAGYGFRVDGKIADPFLMQRLVAFLVDKRRRVGNWSGTGAGKTNSAVLASRVIGAQTTVVLCPNSVVDNWRSVILNVYPESQVAEKTWTPDWDDSSPRYLVLNFESLQQVDSAHRVRDLVAQYEIDFIVIDEVHYAKQRQVESMSTRKKNVLALVSASGDRNQNLAVLGMSATPVINNLQEGKSLVEMITGEEHEDIPTKATLNNCMTLHRHLVTLGIRHVPQYEVGYERDIVDVDAQDWLGDLVALGKKPSILELEKILTEARLPVILDNLEPQTLVYTHLIEGIGETLRDAIEEKGYRVGLFTGADKSGLKLFLDKKIDVLIGTSAIGTGVDGLQHVCRRLVFNVLPWTHAEFVQIQGRIYRQGQKQNVKLVVPRTFVDLEEGRWSWCSTKLDRLEYKKTIADAAVDGVVPEGQLRTPAQALQDAMAWLRRLQTGDLSEIERRKIRVPLPLGDAAERERRVRRFGDFSKMNRRWNGANSTTTHARLQESPEEWQQYHTLYQEARKTWPAVPLEELAAWASKADGWQIGDFGCGEALLAEQLSDRHVVHSFDHVAINEHVVACDISNVPLEDSSLDVAVFSLSLMGRNFRDYLREAHRTLKVYGHIHIVEASSRFTDVDGFRASLEVMGFERVAVRKIGDRFTWFHGSRADGDWTETTIAF